MEAFVAAARRGETRRSRTGKHLASIGSWSNNKSLAYVPSSCTYCFVIRRFDSGVGLSIFYRILLYLMRMSDDEIDDANSEQPLRDAPHYVWQYFATTNHTDAKKSGAKNAICAFCDKNFSGCSTSRAAAARHVS